MQKQGGHTGTSGVCLSPSCPACHYRATDEEGRFWIWKGKAFSTDGNQKKKKESGVKKIKVALIETECPHLEAKLQ